MDSIEKAMLGRLPSPIVPLPVAPLEMETPVLPTKSDVIERAAGRTIPPPSGAAGKPVATVKRTQRSVMLDFQRIQATGLLVPDTRRSRIKEEYRYIKRPLLMNVDGKGAATTEYANLIVVTSARSGEGKTFTACNLALSIATERNRTVLLVDADVLKPTMVKTLGFETELGLVDFLIDDQLDLADVLVDTNVPSLTVLPAGSQHHLSTELLAGEKMRLLAMEMSRRYPDRVVIFDSPPLLATTEASVLARLMGQVVMVVEAGCTQQSQVKAALALLDPNQSVGFVLNKTRGYLGQEYYGYGYGGGDDSSGSEVSA